VTLENALRELAEARTELEIAKEWTAQLLTLVKAMPAYQKFSAAQDSELDLVKAITVADLRVRELALKEHLWSGSYKPAGGVQIKEFSKVVYAPNLALDWCIAHATKYLQLDTKAFEKAASVLRDLGAPVELTKEARAQIATNLSAWIQRPGVIQGQMETLLDSEEINLLREEQDLAETWGR